MLYKNRGAADGRMMTAVARYAAQWTRWKIALCEHPLSEAGLIRTWRPEGVMMNRSPTPEAARMFSSRRLPVVGFGFAPSHALRPRVSADGGACGRMAAEYFLCRGFRQLAFVGKGHVANARAMAAAFAEAAAGAAVPCEVRMEPKLPVRHPPLERYLEEVISWLRGLLKPAGLMIFSDILGNRITQACEMGGWHIPQDISLVSVGNNEHRCAISTPALSSIDVDPERIGREAAQVVDAMLKGGKRRRDEILVPPAAVVERGSSDVIAVGDPPVAAAIRLIRERCPQTVNVDELAREAGVCRRRLERRFREVLHTTPAREVRRQKVERIKDLLRDDNLRIEEVAACCDFAGYQDMWRYFRRETGLCPADYREQHQVLRPPLRHTFPWAP